MMVENLKIRQQYGHCDAKALSELAERIVETSGDESDQAFRSWLVSFCLQKLRPRSSATKPIEWCRWLALLFRYIEPISYDAPHPPHETKAFIDMLRKRGECIKTLMFGDYDSVVIGLQEIYDLQRNNLAAPTTIENSEERAEILAAVQQYIKNASDKTLTDASRYFVNRDRERGQSLLGERLHAELHTSSHLTLPELLGVINKSRRDNIENREKFEKYLMRANLVKPNSGLGEYITYLVMQFEDRMNLLTSLAMLFRRLSVFIAITATGEALLARLTYGVVSEILGTLLFFTFVVACLIIFVVLIIIVFMGYLQYRWVQTTLRWLELVLGELDLTT